MLSDNIFQKIIERKIPAEIVYEDEHCLAFRDINPQAPTHVLIIPRKVIATHDDIAPDDAELRSEGELVKHKGPQPKPSDEAQSKKTDQSSGSE